MLYLHVSNRTENLLLHLVEVLRIGERRSLFEKEFFLIQSQGMERIISQTLADHFTSWCNFEFVLPMRFLHYSADKLGIEAVSDGYDRGIMTWRFEELLRDLSGEEYGVLQQYLAGPNRGLKRFQLAEQLAHIFDQYQVMRPDMLAAWEQGKTYVDDPSAVWQMALWQRLAAQSEGTVHRGVLLEKLIGNLAESADLSEKLPPRLSVFGLSIMPPLFLKFLQGVSRHCEVHLFVLSPCKTYWGDIESRRKQLERTMNSTGPVSLLDESPEAHPLLTSLGQQGRDFQRMLFDDIAFEVEFASYDDPAACEDPTLLQQVQSGLLDGEAPGAGDDRSEDDVSIQIVSCHSKIRELDVLKEHIFHWLYQDPELQLRDIVIMAPDIQEYSSLIPAIFSDIQHSISDRSLRRRNMVISAFGDFLTLLQGRFGWDELLDLLKEPAVAGKLRLSAADMENIRNWVVGSGIRWGLSATQRKELALPGFEESTWEAGLARLLMGYAIDSDNFIDGVLPFGDIEGSSAGALGGLCQFVSVVEQAREDFGIAHTLEEWASLLKSYARQLFDQGEKNGRDYLELQEILTDLGASAAQLHKEEVEFEVIACWLDKVTKEVRSSSGFLRGQLTFCSMLPMRSIPFKKVCLIGLNEGVFPQNDRYATFDLMGKDHRPGDRSRRMDDRYQFLEALMAAREQLYISYIGQSVKTNDHMPPSVVVDELLDLLTNFYGLSSPVVHHPLQPFSALYFSGKNDNVFSYDSYLCKVAEKLQLPPVQGGEWWKGKRDGMPDHVKWDDLLQFFRNPQKWFVRYCLGIRLGSDIETTPESEIFQLGNLERYQIDHYLLEQLRAGSDMEEIRTRLRVSGRWPLGTPGELEFDDKLEVLGDFAAVLSEAGMGAGVDNIDFEFDDGPCPLRGSLENVHEKGILLYRFTKMKGGDLLSAWLHHVVYSKIVNSSVMTQLVCLDNRITFTSDPPFTPDLDTLLQIFIDGCLRPSPLYVEPGYAWLKKAGKGDAGMAEAARKSLRNSLDNGYDPEIALLLSGCDMETVLGEEFEMVCRTVLEPIAGSWK